MKPLFWMSFEYVQRFVLVFYSRMSHRTMYIHYIQSFDVEFPHLELELLFHILYSCFRIIWICNKTAFDIQDSRLNEWNLGVIEGMSPLDEHVAVAHFQCI